MKSFRVGVLEKDLAYKCAQQYFDEIEIDLTQISQNGQYEKFIQIFSGLSGAQIKELAYATGSYMASKQIDTFSLETLNHVKNDMVKSAMKSDELQKNNSLEETQKIGFGNRVNNFD